ATVPVSAVHTPTTQASTAVAPANAGNGVSSAQQSGAPVRSTSPAVKPAVKPKSKGKPKPARKSSKKQAKGRHAPAPPETVTPSTPPAADLPTTDTGAVQSAGAGISTAATVSQVITPPADSAAQDNGKKDKDGGNGNKDKEKDKDKDKHKK